MKILVMVFLTIFSSAYSSDQFLQQCQDFRNRIEENVIRFEDIMRQRGDEIDEPPFICIFAGRSSTCVADKHFKSYTNSISLEISNKEINLYNDELLRCSFFTFHTVRQYTDMINGTLFLSLLRLLPSIKDLDDQKQIHDTWALRGTLYHLELSLEEIQYIYSLDLIEWPTRIELNDILNNYMINQYGLPKETRIDFIRLMLEQDDRERLILLD